MNEITYVMFTLLFVVVIFIIYFFQLSRRIDALDKRIGDIQDDLANNNLTYASHLDSLYGSIRYLGESIKGIKTNE